MPSANTTKTKVRETPPRKSVAPLPVRRIRANIELKDLRLDWIAEKATVPYQMASALLTGRRVDPALLTLVERAVNAAPSPEDTL